MEGSVYCCDWKQATFWTKEGVSNKKKLRKEILRYCLNQFEDIEWYATTYDYPINNWNVSMITDLSGIFANWGFKEYIGDWNVSKATNMSGMFSFAHKFN